MAYPFFKKFYPAIFFIAIFLLPQNSYSQNIPHGGALVLATSSDPKSFNTIVAKETSTSEIMGYIFEGLTKTNVFTLKVEPLLAESWEVNAAGNEWIFHLRKDVLWNDGVPFTADDVVFTFNDLIFNEDIPSSSRDTFTIE